MTVRIEARNGHHSPDAQNELERQRTFGGYGADTDIIVASAKAYLSALNKLLVAAQAPAERENSAAMIAV